MSISKEPCKVCGSLNQSTLVDRAIDYEYGIDYHPAVVRCMECRLVFQQPTPARSQLDSFYPSDYANYSKSHSPITRILTVIYEHLAARELLGLVGKTGRVFDVGCGDGYYLELMRKFGDWTLCGSDINAGSVESLRNKGYEAYAGELEAIPDSVKHFDLLRMNHLLEHVVNPATTIQRAYELLKPGGCLYVETPNTACPDFHAFGRYWGALHMPRHIHLFNPSNLKRLLKRIGFEHVSVSHTLMTTGWAMGIQNFLRAHRDLKLVAGRASFYPLLLLAFLPCVFVQKVFHASTMMRVIAVKNTP